MKNKSKGGPRSGAGRKPSVDPKQQISLFVETSIINSYGGKHGLRSVLYSVLETANPKTLRNECFDPKLLNKELIDSMQYLTPASEIEVKPNKVKALTKITNALKPQEQPRTNYSINTAPKTLEELKSHCPKELTGLDRAAWISTERQKYGI